MASSRDLRRVDRPVKLDRRCYKFAAQAHHLDGGHGGLKSLVSRLDAGAVQRLLQRFAGQHAKAVRNACLLLRLADAARHFVVDRLVVRGFAAQQAAERHDRVHLALVWRQLRARRRNLPRAGNADHLEYRRAWRRCAAARRARLEQPLGDHRVPARHHDCKLHSRGGEIAFDGHRLALQRIGPGPEAEANPGSGSTVKMRDFQWVSVIGERRVTAHRRLRAQPGLRRLMHGIQRGHFDQHIGGGWKLAIDKLQIAQRSQK